MAAHGRRHSLRQREPLRTPRWGIAESQRAASTSEVVNASHDPQLATE
jgi:hypothetical protein